MYRSHVRILPERETKNREHFGDNHIKKSEEEILNVKKEFLKISYKNIQKIFTIYTKLKNLLILNLLKNIVFI